MTSQTQSLFIVEPIYPNDEAGYHEEFKTLEEAKAFFDKEVIAIPSQDDDHGYDYITLTEQDKDGNYLTTHHSHVFNPLSFFDNIPEDLWDDIDEAFFHWCQSEGVDYSADEKDYPDEFKVYYVMEDHPWRKPEAIKK